MLKKIILLIIIFSINLSVSYGKNSDINNPNNMFKSINEIRCYMRIRGYSEMKYSPSFVNNYLYLIVYYEEIPKNTGLISTGVNNNDGVHFNLEYYNNKPKDPNLYTYCFFKINNKKYWFIKINYMLKVTRIMTYIDYETKIEYKQKEFY